MHRFRSWPSSFFPSCCFPPLLAAHFSISFSLRPHTMFDMWSTHDLQWIGVSVYLPGCPRDLPPCRRLLRAGLSSTLHGASFSTFPPSLGTRAARVFWVFLEQATSGRLRAASALHRASSCDHALRARSPSAMCPKIARRALLCRSRARTSPRRSRERPREGRYRIAHTPTPPAVHR
ncbi:hypothetical protein C8Q73DRAFT_13110 [Cubamyces lactineus]|nr:hypothetical protein C8Q73DRAFT_13110 [Cubamyces lactineus]